MGIDGIIITNYTYIIAICGIIVGIEATKLVLECFGSVTLFEHGVCQQTNGHSNGEKDDPSKIEAMSRQIKGKQRCDFIVFVCC